MTGWLVFIISYVTTLITVTGYMVNSTGKNVSASSFLADNPPERAVDGDRRATMEFVFHTLAIPISAWFSVDMEEEIISPSVTIYFRTEYKRRRNGVRISLSNEEVSTTDFCETVTGAANGSDIPDIYTFSCEATGRYLTISTVTANDDSGAILDFAEVEVDVTGNMVNLTGKNVSASSFLSDNPPERAVDGDRRATMEFVFHTLAIPVSAWFSVDMEEEIISPEVTIYFRIDYKSRRNSVRISLSNEGVSTTDFCEIVTGAANGSDIADIYTFSCEATGRYLTISTVTANDDRGAILDFAEVEAYACPQYKFGLTCESDCHCADEPCDWRLETPVCSSGCMPGWKSSACDTLISASDVTYFQSCNTNVTFTLGSVTMETLMEMEVLSERSRVECIQKCYRLILCMAAEYTNPTCTLWRTGSSGPAESRDMWRRKT